MPSGSGSKRLWTEHERTAVIRGMARYGHDYTQLATLVPPRTAKAVERYIDRHALNRNSKLGDESDERNERSNDDVVDGDDDQRSEKYTGAAFKASRELAMEESALVVEGGGCVLVSSKGNSNRLGKAIAYIVHSNRDKHDSL